MTTTGLGAILVGAFTAMMTSLGSLIAVLGQVDMSTGAETGLLVTGSSAGMSAAALAYVVRMVVSGRLVHRDVEENEEELRKLVAESMERERVYAQFIEKRIG